MDGALIAAADRPNTFDFIYPTDATVQDMEEAARIAALLPSIHEFADRFDTLLGERGVRLSGGQKQRTAAIILQEAGYAALVRQPKIRDLGAGTGLRRRPLGRPRNSR